MQQYIICDDDKKQMEIIKQILYAYDTDVLCETYETGYDLLEDKANINEDAIILMDIVLPKISGVDIAKKINKHVKHAVIIFISAYIEKALEVYDATHCYFVLKTELSKRLPDALTKAQEVICKDKEKLSLFLKDRTVVLSLSDIIYIERIKRVSYVYCVTQCYQCSNSLQDLSEYLTSSFMQTHCSFVVNSEYVQEYKRDCFVLINGRVIPISRAYSKSVKGKFQDFLMEKVR